MTKNWKYIPVSNHVKGLSNGEFACLGVGYDILIYPSVVWSGEWHSHGYVWFCRTYFSCYGNAFVYVDLSCIYVCGYVRTITGFNWFKFTRANYEQKDERYESKTKTLALYHTHSEYYILSMSSYKLCKKPIP
jgi:hypothetical protein